MKKCIMLIVVFGLGVVIGALGGGGVLAYAESSVMERWYDTSVRECLQRVHHVAHIRVGQTDRAAEMLDEAIANQVVGILGRMEVMPMTGRREYSEQHARMIQMIHSYMRMFPERFSHVLDHPSLVNYPPLSMDKLSLACRHASGCSEFVLLLERLSEGVHDRQSGGDN